MTSLKMKKKVLGMIEELNPDSDLLTGDPDIAAKINEVMNQVMFELVRLKKIPKYVEMNVKKGDLIEFADIESACGYEIYQLGTVGGVAHTMKADGTVIKILDDGVLEVNCYVYPERIEENTKDKAYEFELTSDLLEIMAYGVAADLLKSDVSAQYGSVYEKRYNDMKQMLDPRYQMLQVTIEGGYDI